MIIADFTTVELEYFRDRCNFVGYEQDLVDLRSRGIPLERIDEQLNMSVDGVKKIRRKVNNKIEKVK